MEFCEAQNIRYIDMLPALRKGEQTDRTYHLRDTHFNAYGNKIVGDALAHGLIDLVLKASE